MKLALEAFKYADSTDHDLQRKAIIALEQAIALQNLTDTHQEMEVADAYQRAWKAETTKQAEQAQPVAKVQLLTTGGNAGLATRIVEIDDPLRDRLRPGQMLYTAPPQRQPLTDEEIEYLYFDKLNCDFKAFARAIEARSGIKG